MRRAGRGLCGTLGVNMGLNGLVDLGGALEAGGNDGDAHLVAQALVERSTPDDVCIGMCGLGDHGAAVSTSSRPMSGLEVMLMMTPRAPAMLVVQPAA